MITTGCFKSVGGLARQISGPTVVPGKIHEIHDTSLHPAAPNSYAELIASRLGQLSKAQGGSEPPYGLQDVLQDPKCCGIFKESLDREGTSQTLLFLMEV